MTPGVASINEVKKLAVHHTQNVTHIEKLAILAVFGLGSNPIPAGFDGLEQFRDLGDHTDVVLM